MAISYQKLINKAELLLNERYANKDLRHENRLNHIKGVASKALELAKIYDVDENKAYLAGLFHDYYKFESKEEMAALLTADELKEAKEVPVLFHSYSSARAFKKLILDDDEIFMAIKHHVYGHDKMSKLEEIILLSDYIEENRTYDNCVKCRNLVNRKLFYTAIYESTRHTIEYNLTKGIKPAYLQVKVLEKYKELAKMELLKIVKEALDKVKASDINCYDMRESSPFYDFMVIASVSSLRQASAVTSYLEDLTKDTPFTIRNREGENTEWVLIDLNDVILSVFTEDERKRVELDKIYLDKTQIEL